MQAMEVALLQAMEVMAFQILQLAMAQAVAVMPTGSGDIADMRKKVVYHGCLATFACFGIGPGHFNADILVFLVDFL